jgi:ankyrin repeat protein
MLELLLAHGVEISRPDPHWGNTPLYFLAGHHEGAPTTVTAVLGMGWLLEHGADPNQPSGESGETPLHQLIRNHRGDDVLLLLLDHGADPNAPRKDGRTPWQMAVRSGHERAAKILADRGADPGRITPLDRFLGAAMRGQVAEARRLLDSGAVSIAELNAEDRGLLVQAANEENLATVDALIDLGFDLAWESEWGGTPLHHAAWNGRLAMVEHLLAKGAPVNIRDHRFGSSPLAWAAHGSRNCRRADEDYLAVIDRLLAAGSNRETSINKWNEPPESMASARVTGYLKKRLGLSGS